MENEYQKKLKETNQNLHKMRISGELYRLRTAYIKKYIPDFAKIREEKSIVSNFEHICMHQRLESVSETFFYTIDFTYLMDYLPGTRLGSFTPAYEDILDGKICDLKMEETSQFSKDINKSVDIIEEFCLRIAAQCKKNNKNKMAKWFVDMTCSEAKHFDEALQRVLFLNQIMWQTGHMLVGFGRIDKYLEPFFTNDIRNEYCTEEDAENMLVNFFEILQEYSWLKSNLILGDTGQIMVLGKTTSAEESYSDLTMKIMQVLSKMKVPDPKLVLRVSKKTPDSVLKQALICIATGVGYPLLANDDVIIPVLMAYGIEPDDAKDYVMSACWEPLIGGKSSSINNVDIFNFLAPLESLFVRGNLQSIDSFDSLKTQYVFFMRKEFERVKKSLQAIDLAYDPIVSLFVHSCRECGKDISKDGAQYGYLGLTTIGLANVVNSLLNIKDYVFVEKKMDLYEVKKLLIQNYENNAELQKILNKNNFFGTESQEIITLVNWITKEFTSIIQEYEKSSGLRIKYGLSAPSYVEYGQKSIASFDGRYKGEPLSVHISNDKPKAYTEIINFSSQLDYTENRFNGNVVDFMVSSSFLLNNIDKFLMFLSVAIKKGFFELQINVIDSKELMDAKINPLKHQNLIVRVWGFSAYFNDLPEKYKDLIIARAKASQI